AQSGKQSRALQKQASEQRQLRCVTQKPAPECEIRLLLHEGGDQNGNIACPMLAIAVESDNEFGPMRQRMIDAGLQGSALTEIHGMADDGGTKCKRDFGRTVA